RVQLGTGLGRVGALLTGICDGRFGHRVGSSKQKGPRRSEASRACGCLGARSDASLPGAKSEAEEVERIHCAAMLPEHEMIELIAGVAGLGDGVVVGIGDDAAVLDGGLVVSTDMLVEGV